MRCKPCRRFYCALEDAFIEDPPLRKVYVNKFLKNARGRRAFIRFSHGVLPDELVHWISTMLENQGSRLRSHSCKTEQCTADNSEALQVIIADCLASQLTFTQDCHIAMYNPSMAHSDSARHRPSSLVPPARSNPLRFVRSAR